jgi:hypothetical protein
MILIMKNTFRKLFAFVLNPFESGSEDYRYKPSHRSVLVGVGALFTGLASVVLYMAWGKDVGYLLPVVIFGLAGLLSLIIGLLGNDRAVAKVWGSR